MDVMYLHSEKVSGGCQTKEIAEEGMASPPPGFKHDVIALPPGALPSKEGDIALDIGGSLAKIAYHCSCRRNGSGLVHELHMVSFDVSDLEPSLQFIRKHVLGTTNHRGMTIRGTGVGCAKYRRQIQEILDARLSSDGEEVQHAARGLDFLWRHLEPAQMLHDHRKAPACRHRCSLEDSGILPCLVVSIGSAAVMVRVDANGCAQPFVVGGSSQGGLTFMGLGVLLTKAKSFGELIDMAERGDHKNVDLLLRDTAGAEYNHMPSDAMVSHFGKAAAPLAHKQGTQIQFKPEDLANSLLLTITHEIAQTTYLIAKTQNISNVCFCGSFLAGNHAIMSNIRTKLAQCSAFLQWQVNPMFVQYESYLGAIGVLVNRASSEMA